MNHKLICTEIAGGCFAAVYAAFACRLYAFSHGELTGILFGAVNNSAWELTKILLLPYLLWGILELMTLHPRVYRFTVAKTAALYLLGALHLPLTLLLPRGLAAAVSLIAASALTILLYVAPLSTERFFVPSVCLLFLFTALYFSLTPFPPQHPLFRDPVTQLYGIPETRFPLKLNTYYKGYNSEKEIQISHKYGIIKMYADIFR